MDDGKLQIWLGLPPGPWPPDDRVLLGIPDGPVDPATVELRALERMDRLRPHQLRHPDLVTEGMNRLAQAMIALTDGGASAAPSPPKPRKHGKRKPKSVDALPENLALSAPGAVAPTAETVAPPPVILDAEIVPVAAAAGPAAAVVDPGEPVPIPDTPPPGTAYIPADRRGSYRELVEVRKLIRTWERLRHTVAVPGDPVATPAKVLSLLETVDELKKYHRPLPVPAGHYVCSVLLHPLPLGVLRSLVPSQRLTLATDWACAAAELKYRYAAIRTGLQRSIPRRRVNRIGRGIRRWIRLNPEWILLLAVLGLLIFGYLRSRPA